MIDACFEIVMIFLLIHFHKGLYIIIVVVVVVVVIADFLFVRKIEVMCKQFMRSIFY